MFPKIDFKSSRIEIFYQKSNDYVLDRPINYFFCIHENFRNNIDHYYISFTDGRIIKNYEIDEIQFKFNFNSLLKKIYSNDINYILTDNKLTFHSLKKEFNFWKRYSSFKKYQKSLLFFEDQFKLPKSIINKIAWYCV
jgi:hypothetical protein